MKAKIVKAMLMALFVCCSSSAFAGYVYWGVSSSLTGVPVAQMSYATLMWFDGASDHLLTTAFTKKDGPSGKNDAVATELNTVYSSRDNFTTTFNKGDPYTPRTAAEMASAGAERWWIEIFNASGEKIWVSGTATYQELATALTWNATAGSNQMVDADSFAFWDTKLTEGQAVPEPTSGLMLLVGTGLLALRRRRRLV